jgi:hypothetical protein
VRLYVVNVRDDGRADLTLGASAMGYASYRSPAASRPPPGTPAGVSDLRLSCEAQVNFGPGHEHAPSVHESSARECREPLVTPPRCTLAEVWQRARGRGAPAGAVATINYGRDRDTGEPDAPVAGEWSFMIAGDEPRQGFHARLADDCGAPPPPAAAAAPADDEVLPVDPAAWRVVAARHATLHACLKKAVAPHPAIEAVDFVAHFTVAAGGKVERVTIHPAMDVEGLFVGDMAKVEGEFARCAGKPLALVRLPPAAPGSDGASHVVLAGRLTTADGALTPIPVTRKMARAAGLQ